MQAYILEVKELKPAEERDLAKALWLVGNRARTRARAPDIPGRAPTQHHTTFIKSVPRFFMTALINWAAARDTLALLPVSSSMAVSTRLVSWVWVKYSAKAWNRVGSDGVISLDPGPPCLRQPVPFFLVREGFSWELMCFCPRLVLSA